LACGLGLASNLITECVPETLLAITDNGTRRQQLQLINVVHRKTPPTNDSLEVEPDSMSHKQSSIQGGGPPFGESDSLEALAARRRAELAASYLAEEDVLRHLEIDHNELAALRVRREILAAWHVPEKRFVYPPFQFSAVGIISELAPLLAHLRAGSSGSGWSEIEWFITPHALLEAHAPADALLVDPARVLKAAEAEFSEDQGACW
jgi:hypothetical protein